MTDPDDPAFPIPGIEGQPVITGLSKREYFAGLAMQGALADGDLMAAVIRTSIEKNNQTSLILANFAVDYADALIAKLSEEPK